MAYFSCVHSADPPFECVREPQAQACCLGSRQPSRTLSSTCTRHRVRFLGKFIGKSHVQDLRLGYRDMLRDVQEHVGQYPLSVCRPVFGRASLQAQKSCIGSEVRIQYPYIRDMLRDAQEHVGQYPLSVCRPVFGYTTHCQFYIID